MAYSTHVYHQYTIKIKNGKRDELKNYLSEQGVPSMIYYPLPLDEQNAFKTITRTAEPLPVAKALSRSVLSLPMHTELTGEEQEFIIEKIKRFFS
jgi:dTDP-4-amino-4,6-dideoxygalactose transaminase